MKNSVIVLCIIVCLVVAGCALLDSSSVQKTDRATIEGAHGLKLPASAQCCQHGGGGMVADKGVVSMAEIDVADLESFLEQLKVRSTRKPLTTGTGDPCVNGWNVWPKDAETFVPGNQTYAGFEKTWSADPTPIQMLSCDSPIGDWLHVEIWKISEGKRLLKLYTDWN